MNNNLDTTKLITFGQMAFEQGWYEQARDYFQQALTLDPSNRQAMRGLARCNEILSRQRAVTSSQPSTSPPPAQQPAQKKRVGWFKRQSRRGKLLILAGVALIFICFCAGLGQMIIPTPEPTQTPVATTTSPATPPTYTPVSPIQIPSPTAGMTPPINTPIPPTHTPLPTPTPLPSNTPTPKPKYQEPITLVELNGVGELVSDNYSLPNCWKAVLYWSVQANDYGLASLIINLHSVQNNVEYPVVNEFAMEVSSLEGSAHVPLTAGTYFFSTENTDQSWALRLDCQDNTAPVVSGLDLQGSGNVVTPNYELHRCRKSIFVWAAHPDSTGMASLILSLCGAKDCIMLANEFGMDLTKPLAGEAVQALAGGSYFLVIENTNGRSWSVRWECRD